MLAKKWSKTFLILTKLAYTNQICYIEVMALDTFHRVIQRLFTERFAAPTEAQKLGWPAIQQRQDTLIAPPTGSGKTLTAFLASLDRLLRLALAGQLAD